MLRPVTVLGTVLLSWACYAASPIATISSTQSVIVSGITVPTHRVISWPVAVHDEIITQTAPAMVRFGDGTVVTLQRNSRMRVESGAAGLEVKMLSGSAIYDIKPHSTVSVAPVVSSMSNTVAVAAAPARRIESSREQEAMALAYRAPATAPKSGMVFAPTAFSTTTFGPAATRQDITTVGGGSRITLPNGTILEVHSVSVGGQSTFVIDKVDIPIQVPGQGLRYVTPTSSQLVGASITVTNSSATNQQVSILLPGSTTPATPTQVQQLLDQAGQSGYQGAVNNGQIPASTPPPQPPSPVTVGTFSAGS